MAYEYSDLLAQAQTWAKTAVEQGYLASNDMRELLTLDAASPEQLFSSSDIESRPLIVAFIGGTGVGKSSLLNRLAGKAIAKAGVERPTSREVTLYHHQDCHLTSLPKHLPVEKTRISEHAQASSRHIIWIDMPDFDSVEQMNKTLVFEWLPHIDALVYVVSPERYRDNKAWQVLKAEGGKHAWLFVMNQWDRAVPAQFDDFKRQLSYAGFSDPVVLYTSCVEPENDLFPELLTQLALLSNQQNMQQMTQHNERQRFRVLSDILQRHLQTLKQQNFSTLLNTFNAHWPQTETTLQNGLAWVFSNCSAELASRSAIGADNKLWDEWAQTQFQDSLEALLQLADQFGIAPKALRPALEEIKAWIIQHAAKQIELRGRQAMFKPGNGVQRFLLRLTAILEIVLPLLAMAVVGYMVFAGYYHSAADATAYLGVDFAVHSVLLIAMSWLIPFFLHKKLQPSLQKAAFSGLNKGLLDILAQARAKVAHALQDAERGKNQCQQTALQLLEQIATSSGTEQAQTSLLKRVLLD